MVNENIPLVTVLMSTYNGEKYLAEQIDSILAQKNVRVHLVVRDDGSKDSTTDLLKWYQENGDLEWFGGKNLGYTESFMELCVHASKADYYAFADQDDVWLSDKLENALKQLTPFQSIPALCVGEWTVVDENLHPMRDPAPALAFSVEKMRCASKEIVQKAACAMNHVTSSGCLQVWNNPLQEILCGRDYPHMPIGHDVIVGMVAILCGQFIPYRGSGILYRQHGNNTSGSHQGWGAVQERWRTHWKRLRNQAGPCISACNAAILKAYQDVIPLNTQKIIQKTIAYKENPKEKVSLLFSDYPTLLNGKDRLKFRLKVLLNRL